MSDDQPPSSQDPPDIAGVALPVTPIPVAPLRFCGSCGAAWQETWTQCPHCLQRRNKPQPDQSYKRDLRAVKSAVGLYFTLLGVSVVAIITSIGSGGALSAGADIGFSIAFSVITLIWCIPRWRQIWPLLSQPFSLYWLPAGAATAVVTFILATSAIWALRLLGGHEIKYCDTFVNEGYGYGWAILMICVQPGVFEELGFRGVIQSSFLDILRPIEALVVTACMFAILHLSIHSLPHLLILGLALGWLRMKTGSLYPGMVLHFSHNFLVILAEIYGGLLPW